MTSPSPTPARQRILEAASELFHLHGMAATSVDRILQASDTGKSQFYHYFGSKQGLVDAVLDHHAAEKVEHLRACLRDRPPAEGVRRWLRDIVRTQAESGLCGGCPIASMAAEAREEDVDFRDKLGLAFDAQLEVLTEALGGTEHPGAPPADSIAMRVLAAVQGGMLLASTLKDPALLDEAIAAAENELARWT